MSRPQSPESKPQPFGKTGAEAIFPGHDAKPTNQFVAFPKDEVEQSIPQRFEKIVRQFPDSIAVKTADQVVSYAELNAQANRVARALMAARGQKAEPVALLIENGISLTAAILGVLKAGKFFVLIDASLPASRVEIILRDSQAELVVCSSKNILLATSATPDGCSAVEIEGGGGDFSAADIGLSIAPDALASVAYTSGSTGQPKGVCQNHQNLLHNMMLRAQESEVSHLDRVSLLTSGTANSIYDILFPLLMGAMLVPFDVRRHGVNRLISWLIDENVSLCWISSPLFRKLCDTLKGDETFSALRLIRLRSDSVCKQDIERFRSLFPTKCRLLTGLSSSETGIIRILEVDRAAEFLDEDVPVGYPVDGKEILLVDERGREVGADQVGEIVVRSRYLSPGYWRRPDLTADKFRTDPRNSETRLYYTGDLGLMRSDGCLIHKGRKDFRVKIRGFGVEIAEVEKVLLGHPDLKEVVVAARQNDSGETRLVGYYSPRGTAAPTVSELRTFMNERLPEYMIPAAFVKLDALPLTPNGKVDRQALPEPGNYRPELDTPLVCPRSEIEETLAQIWSELLGVDSLGINDNFFDLGGDSLLASRLVSRIFQVFEIELSVGQLFQSPTVAAIACLVNSLSQKKKNSHDLAPIVVSRISPLPLSFAQQRLWFLDQLAPGNCVYNLLSAFQITGRIDTSALERSINEVIARHEALRTVFDAVDGQPYQNVLPSLTIGMPIIDLSHIESFADYDAEFRVCCAAAAQQPFDVTTAPLLRVCLVRRGDENHRLFVVIHHIIFDGWSMGVFCRELSASYEAFACGSTASLPIATIQYPDFAHWQRACLEGDVSEGQMGYWRRQLDGIAPLQLPADRRRPSFQSNRGAKRIFSLSEDLSGKLKRLGSNRGATLFMTLLAAFQTLLHRYTGQNDIVVGCPVAGRSRKEVEDLIGFFLNMLIFRSDTSGDPTFRELLDRVRKVCLEAYAHQDVPFEKLVEDLHPQRELSRNPLVQVTFAFQNTPQFSLKLGEASVSQLSIDSGFARFDLSLFMEEAAGRLQGHFSYNADLFDDESMDQLAGHFVTLLEGIVTDADRPISRLPLLTEAERHQLLVERNDTKRNFLKDKCIHELFEGEVNKSPDSVALVLENQQLTYRELNCRANQLAHYLRNQGVGPETLVAICLERSIEMVVGLLGVLKAGGAYLALDPAYPKQRMEFMLDDSQTSVLLTQERLMEELAQERSLQSTAGAYLTWNCDPRLKVICLDRDWGEISEESEESLQGLAAAQNLAYVIYTSGSTGRPKAVMIEHRNAVAFLNWAHSVFTNEDFAGVIASTSICFDLSVFELFAPLTAGGRVILVENALALGQLDLAVELTLVNTVPSIMAELLRLGELPASIRTVNLAGEPLKTSLVQEIYKQTSAQQVYDLYGPSETTTYSTYTHRTADGVQTIGRPIANTQVYILDSYRNPAPIGVPGEIYLGGAGLARGYLNGPELTAEKFIANPFSTEPGARLYKTGDLARYLPDGNIEFIGRVDNQVKIRGFRIELGEIEAVLSQHPAIRECVVDILENLRGDSSASSSDAKTLVAYVVVHKRGAVTTEELRNSLKRTLPGYMIPGSFVYLDSLPLTPNGKVDRESLPAPDQSRPELENAFITPRTPMEKFLAQIWLEVINVSEIGIHDDFFSLGGHSLMGMQVISRMRKAFGVEIPLRALFESPTIEQMAAVITHNQVSAASQTQLAHILSEVEKMTDAESQKLLSRKTGQV